MVSRQSFSLRVAVSAFAAAAALVLAGCGSTVTGTPLAADNAGPASTAPTTSAGSPTTTGAAPTTGVNKGGSTDFQANIGDCVQLGGTTDNATIERASCGSQSSNYKVVGKARTNDQCPTDVDQAYYETLNGIETGALCLDIDWVIGGCLELGGEDPERIDCSSTTAIEGVQVLAIERNTTSVDDCTQGDQGYVYDERRFVVCVTPL
ncbi:LppU family putative lipoprotein [Nocardia otitidiscaviarum]|uniref:LppU family putative lipoprotein n=1 Tax=Nocardia otitidiscaviarum TaxID=1823 RepID=UPI00155962AB|nr:hypothetical protein [Nocardia otitidiscaviarum]MBF6237894.1 hypothetical protein [Nocardia otitidiscaviarum]